MATDKKHIPWTDDQVAEQFQREIKTRLERNNVVVLRNEQAEIDKLVAEGKMQRDAFPARGAITENLYEQLIFQWRNNAMQVILPDYVRVDSDTLELFDHTSVAWSRVRVIPVLHEHLPKLAIDLIFIDVWTDAKDTEWRLAREREAPPTCGCHCKGGCGDPYAACMWPCDDHIPL